MTKKTLTSVVCSLFVTMTASSAIADETAERTARGEQFLAKTQKICPVTGKDLTSMGGPFKAEVEGQTVFLCCKGCVGRKMSPQHWATVQKNLRTAHLALAQQICPVTGKDLTSMGGPFKTEVEGQTVFLCCKGCLKKQVKPKYWNQIRTNRIAAQGKCPVMGKPLPKDATSIIVDKREIFVCCPKCTARIEAAPEKYVAIVDKLLAKNLSPQRRPAAQQQPGGASSSAGTAANASEDYRRSTEQSPHCSTSSSSGRSSGCCR